jgi:hypothetical protein
MLTGDKPAERHPGAVDAKSPGAVAWLVSAVVVVAASYLIIQYDPDAFALRSAESFEHRAVPDGGPTEAEEPENDR